MCIISSRIFWAKFQNLVLNRHTELATVTGLLKYENTGSDSVLIKQNLPYSVILPSKNSRFKAWPHSVRKANYPSIW